MPCIAVAGIDRLGVVGSVVDRQLKGLNPFAARRGLRLIGIGATLGIVGAMPSVVLTGILFESYLSGMVYRHLDGGFRHATNARLHHHSVGGRFCGGYHYMVGV